MNIKRKLKSFHKKCLVCDSIKDLSIDHIRPSALGGSSELLNYLVLCSVCNSSKGSIEPREWLKGLSNVSTDNEKILKNIIDFNDYLYCQLDITGTQSIQKIDAIKCYLCNPNWIVSRYEHSHVLIPDYFKSFLYSNKEIFKHSDCKKESNNVRIIYGAHPTKPVSVIDASKTFKDLVMCCNVPDKARTFLDSMTIVIKQDKFFVRGVNSCFCQVLVPETNKVYFIHEQNVHMVS